VEEQRTPDKRIYEKRSDVDWGENRHRLRFPLERLLLWCNDFEEKQLKIIVDNSTHLPGAILETMVKIARILISILVVPPSGSGLQSLGAAVTKVSKLINDHNHGFDKRASSPYYDDPGDSVLESLEANVDNLYELGPAMKGLLINIRDGRSPKRTKISSPVAQPSQNSGELRPTSPQQEFKKTHEVALLPHANNRATREGRASPPTASQPPKNLSSSKRGQNPLKESVVPSDPPPIPCRNCRKIRPKCNNEGICTACKSQESPGIEGGRDSNAEMLPDCFRFPSDEEAIPAMDAFWEKVHKWKVSQDLILSSGRQIFFKFSDKPFHNVLKAMKENLPKAPGLEPPLGVVHIDFDVWNMKLASEDQALPAEFAIRFIEPYSPRIMRQINMQKPEDPEILPLLNTIASIGNILQSLWASAIQTAETSEGVARTVLFLAYISILQIYLESFNDVWRRICLYDRQTPKSPSMTQFKEIYRANIENLLTPETGVQQRYLTDGELSRLQNRLSWLKEESSQNTGKQFASQIRYVAHRNNQPFINKTPQDRIRSEGPKKHNFHDTSTTDFIHPLHMLCHLDDDHKRYRDIHVHPKNVSALLDINVMSSRQQFKALPSPSEGPSLRSLPKKREERVQGTRKKKPGKKL